MYKDWRDFIKGSDKDLLNSEMTFSSMDKGVMHYNGNHKGKKLYCSVSEACVSDYNYSVNESVSSLTQGYYVFLTLDGQELLNTH